MGQLLTAAFLVLPTGYIVYVALTAAPTVWTRLWSTRIPELLGNTLSLAASVALTTLGLGLSLAWLIVRYEFPGRRLWEWALALPLAMPTYVLAYVYAHLLGWEDLQSNGGRQYWGLTHDYSLPKAFSG
jgi:iron(III) transport system permease protein